MPPLIRQYQQTGQTVTPEHGIKDNFNIPCSGNPVKENFLKGGHGMGAGSPKTPDGRDPGVIRRPDEGRPLIEIDYVPVQHFLISQNITKMKERFPLTSGGVFGEKGKNVAPDGTEDSLLLPALCGHGCLQCCLFHDLRGGCRSRDPLSGELQKISCHGTG